ncbi:hypothetical protein DE146DRAFT_641701 [Phaeosphaeria sp. MPI-PUGE-AT-0046c]|nr:hypothetical protein DE146DRAFT_641701 [Phaeosphaeria sp. MPI-PUGE-AT-0046c]
MARPTAIVPTPAANGKTKHSTTRFSDQYNTTSDTGNKNGNSLREVQITALDQSFITHLVDTGPLASFISATISLFGPMHLALTSRTFWTTQIFLELDFVLWRTEFLGREPSDAEMEYLANECTEMMWLQIVKELKKGKDELCRKKQKEEEEKLVGHECCAKSRRRKRRTMRLSGEIMSLEGCLDGMSIGADGEEEELEDHEDHEEGQKSRVCKEDAGHRRCLVEERESKAHEYARGSANKGSRYSGQGVTYVLGSMSGRHEDDVGPAETTKSKMRPVNSACLLKKTLAQTI